MNPQLFLRTFWRFEPKPQIFVAMSFDKKYDERYYNIISPAIKMIEIDGIHLEPYRADLSKTGDSILTDIIDCIAHSQLILADVSVVGCDSITGKPYRNSNVMYEVGLALSCRQSSEVLLIRDDNNEFLFDLSTVPHLTIDFNIQNKAIDILTRELNNRIDERNLIEDVRVRIIAESLTADDIKDLRLLCSRHFDSPHNEFEQMIYKDMYSNITGQGGRLLDKQLIRYVGKNDRNKGIEMEGIEKKYLVTKLGYAVNKLINKINNLAVDDYETPI